MEQRSPEWFAARLGKVTASRVADVVAKTRSGPGASRANYEAELIVERLTGEPAPRFTTAAMEWGTETEAQARETYAFLRAVEVAEVGFVSHPSIAMSGASPDGVVGDDGLVEIKCPNTATHLATILGESAPEKHVTQMQWQMACTGRLWCDFVSFDPRLPEHLAMFVCRVERDADRIATLEAEVRDFLGGLDAKVARLSALAEAA
jgi:putative phage-type endonuclease